MGKLLPLFLTGNMQEKKKYRQKEGVALIVGDMIQYALELYMGILVVEDDPERFMREHNIDKEQLDQLLFETALVIDYLDEASKDVIYGIQEIK